MKKILFVNLFLCPIFSFSQASLPARIESILMEKRLVTRVFIKPGLASVLVFPCPVSEVIVGDNNLLQVEISGSFSKQVTLSLKSHKSATNLLARCKDHGFLFAFDITPHPSSHQDVIYVQGFSGSLLKESTLSLVDSSSRKKEESNTSQKNQGHEPAQSEQRVIEISPPVFLEKGVTPLKRGERP